MVGDFLDSLLDFLAFFLPFAVVRIAQLTFQIFDLGLQSNGLFLELGVLLFQFLQPARGALHFLFEVL